MPRASAAVGDAPTLSHAMRAAWDRIVLADADALSASRADPVALATDAGLAPDPWQAGVLTTDAPRLLLNVSRQAGKSTVAALLALHTALYQPGSLILLLSPSLRQSQELFRKVMDAYGTLGVRLPAEAESALRLELTTGSRIIALPGKEGTIRGYSGVRLLVIDEASRVPDDLYYALRPMLAVSGGRLIAMSTPWGRRGWWHQEWTEGPGWERVEVPATDCKRIPAAFLAEERASLPAAIYRQEYECSFEELDGSIFHYADVMAALDADVPVLFGAR